MDNIGVFDRTTQIPSVASFLVACCDWRFSAGCKLHQADGTAWMGMFCLNMLAIALELAPHKRAYEDIATKFLEHFIYIASAIK